MIGIGIDAGTKAVRIVEVRGKAGVWRVTRFVERPRAEGESLADALRATIVEGKVSGKNARVGLTGRDALVRYLQVPPVPEWQLRNLMKIEVEGLASGPGGEVAADYNLLPVPRGLGGEDTVLLAAAKAQVLEETLAAAAGTKLSIGAFTPNAVGLYAAYLLAGPEPKAWTLLANLGDENTDVALVHGTDLSFARNLAGGGKAFTEAVSQRFNVSAAKAERLKADLANLDPAAKDRYASSQEEKVSHAALGAAGQTHTLLQSVAMLAKTQARVADAKVERVFVCGGGGSLRGLPDYLSSSLGLPVEPFDPFDSLDLTGLPPADAAALGKSRLAGACALGLALLAASPEAYSLEILPASVARRRAFARQGAFLVAAGVLAVAFLVADFAVTWKRASTLGEEARRLAGANRQREKTDADTEALLAEAASLARKASLLDERASAGAGLVRALALVRRRLPEDLWLTRVAVDRKSDPGLRTGEEPRPVVVVEGRGREGVSGIEEIFALFTKGLEEANAAVFVRGAGRVANPGKGEGGFQFTIELNLFPTEAG